MTMISLPSLLIMMVATVAFASADAGMIQPRAGSLKFQALHQMLSIGDDPSHAIHTNILINMEGL
jgi:hypothetical protein